MLRWSNVRSSGSPPIETRICKMHCIALHQPFGNQVLPHEQPCSSLSAKRLVLSSSHYVVLLSPSHSFWLRRKCCCERGGFGNPRRVPQRSYIWRCFYRSNCQQQSLS